MNLKFLTAAFVFALSAGSVLAQPVGNRRVVVLEKYDQVFQNFTTFRIKQEIRQQHPGLRLRRWNIRKVVVVAKAGPRAFNATATLRAGGLAPLTQSLPNALDRWDFRDNSPQSYHRVHLPLRGFRQANGPVQVDLQGARRFKVKRIRVVLERSFGPVPGPGPFPGPGPVGGPLSFSQVGGEQRVDKFVYENLDFYPQGVARGLRISARKNTIDVRSVVVTFQNGQRMQLHQLTGVYGNGQALQARFGGARRISRVEVMASTTGMFGSRGKLSLFVGR